MVQWLRLHHPVQRVWGWIPGRGAKIPHASRSKKLKHKTFNEDFKKYGPHAKNKVKKRKRIARQKRQWGRALQDLSRKTSSVLGNLSSLLPALPQLRCDPSPASPHPSVHTVPVFCPLGCGLLQTGLCSARTAPLHPCITPLRQPGGWKALRDTE